MEVFYFFYKCFLFFQMPLNNQQFVFAGYYYFFLVKRFYLVAFVHKHGLKHKVVAFFPKHQFYFRLYIFNVFAFYIVELNIVFFCQRQYKIIQLAGPFFIGYFYFSGRQKLLCQQHIFWLFKKVKRIIVQKQKWRLACIFIYWYFLVIYFYKTCYFVRIFEVFYAKVQCSRLIVQVYFLKIGCCVILPCGQNECKMF